MIIAEFHPLPDGWRKFRRPKPRRRYVVEWAHPVGANREPFYRPTGNPKGYWTRSGAIMEAEQRATWSRNHIRVVDRWLD